MGTSYMIGIDPGLTGALALLDSNSILEIIDMPLTEDRFKSGKPTVDATILAEMLKMRMRTYFQASAVIERVSAAPEQGVSSTFRFGESYGVVQGVMAGLGIKVQTVPPSVWKPSLNLSRDKKDSLNAAKDLFPRNLQDFKRVKDHGRAEAALLAYYGVKNFLHPSDAKFFLVGGKERVKRDVSELY